MFQIIENADGTATILRAGNKSVVGTYASADDAMAWIEDRVLTAETDERAKAKGLKRSCHYCGRVLAQGACSECGTEI